MAEEPAGDVQGRPDPKAALSSAVTPLPAVDTMKLVYQGVVMRLLWAGMLTHTAGDARVSPWGVPTRCVGRPQVDIRPANAPLSRLALSRLRNGTDGLYRIQCNP